MYMYIISVLKVDLKHPSVWHSESEARGRRTRGQIRAHYCQQQTIEIHLLSPDQAHNEEKGELLRKMNAVITFQTTKTH